MQKDKPVTIRLSNRDAVVIQMVLEAVVRAETSLPRNVNRAAVERLAAYVETVINAA